MKLVIIINHRGSFILYPGKEVTIDSKVYAVMKNHKFLSAGSGSLIVQPLRLCPDHLV